MIVGSVMAGIAGLILGFRIKSRVGPIILISTGILSAIFWLFAQNGWWAESSAKTKPVVLLFINYPLSYRITPTFIRLIMVLLFASDVETTTK